MFQFVQIAEKNNCFEESDKNYRPQKKILLPNQLHFLNVQLLLYNKMHPFQKCQQAIKEKDYKYYLKYLNFKYYYTFIKLQIVKLVMCTKENKFGKWAFQVINDTFYF